MYKFKDVTEVSIQNVDQISLVLSKFLIYKVDQQNRDFRKN